MQWFLQISAASNNKQVSSPFLWSRAWLSLEVLTHCTGCYNQGSAPDAVISKLSLGWKSPKFAHMDFPASPQSFLLGFPQMMGWGAWKNPQPILSYKLGKRLLTTFSTFCSSQVPTFSLCSWEQLTQGQGVGLENVEYLTTCKKRAAGKELIKGLNIQRDLKNNY